MNSRFYNNTDGIGIGGVMPYFPSSSHPPEPSPTTAGDYNSDDPRGGGDVLLKEHMFDKVVTPSDVGKLNRLVIPKQHAEKYFPLDSSAADKGLLLNFEDRSGKPWRFRYSYWNSSQSYVITKGWSRFVKDKKLDAGDVVSFHRSKDRLFIDWRRRPYAPPGFENSFHRSSIYPSWNSNPLFLNPQNSSIFYFRSPTSSSSSSIQLGQTENSKFGGNQEIVKKKRFRLFGVNMDCPIPDSDHPPAN